MYPADDGCDRPSFKCTSCGNLWTLGKSGGVYADFADLPAAQTQEGGQAVSTVGEDYSVEQDRIRTVLSQYEELYRQPYGKGCAYALVQVRATLREADEAAISGDIVRIIAAYKNMKETE